MERAQFLVLLAGKSPELADSFKNSAQYVSTINSKTPDALFYSLLYQYGTIDRNSWIISDIDKQLANSNGVSKSNGMDFTIYSKVPNGDTKVGIVNYVVLNSPAYNAGIKREMLLQGLMVPLLIILITDSY